MIIKGLEPLRELNELRTMNCDVFLDENDDYKILLFDVSSDDGMGSSYSGLRYAVKQFIELALPPSSGAVEFDCRGMDSANVFCMNEFIHWLKDNLVGKIIIMKEWRKMILFYQKSEDITALKMKFHDNIFLVQAESISEMMRHIDDDDGAPF